MRLTAGTKLGPYEIPSPCVKGEVYRAIRNLNSGRGGIILMAARLQAIDMAKNVNQ